MISLVDLNYYSYSLRSDPEEVISLQRESVGYAEWLNETISILMIRHLNFKGSKMIRNIPYQFFKSGNTFFHIPLSTILYLRKHHPDIIMIQGFVFPIQVIALRWVLGRRVVLMAQHHGGKPYHGWRRKCQQIADQYIHAYLFTDVGNASEWINKNIISNRNKCVELLGASTEFSAKDRPSSKKRLALKGNHNFLWVGRLNKEKDPLTVLSAFSHYCQLYREARLYMIYQTQELLPEIQQFLTQHEPLGNSVVLMGRLPHEELESWYNAANFFISGSHRESCGFALIEAMACGCIPIVPSIPSFQKITQNGSFGFLFEPGNPDSLTDILGRIHKVNQEILSAAVMDHFRKSLSFEAIAKNLQQICEKLVTK